ncbi:hypothetical protein WMF20_12200 [Sorangium sp. So ce834]|uniref:hypothetical protein n=1 Tax=Sorangium sp. So ce834 TaxID=3133321 RepID=UPI003F6439AD
MTTVKTHNWRTSRRTSVLGALVLGALTLGNARPAQAQEPGGLCIEDFSDSFALSNVHDQARTHFGTWSTVGAGGTVVPCSNPAGAVGCWLYRARCGFSRYYVHVYPAGPYNPDHLHLPFSNPSLQPLCGCDPGDGGGLGYGYRVNNVCSSTCPDWANEPRAGTFPHTNADAINIEVDNTALGSSTFDLFDITIGGDKTVELVWFDGTNLRASGPLTPGYHELDVSNTPWVQLWDYNHFWDIDDEPGPIHIIDLGVSAPGS